MSNEASKEKQSNPSVVNHIRVVLDWTQRRERVVLQLFRVEYRMNPKTKYMEPHETVIDQEFLRRFPLAINLRLKAAFRRLKRRQNGISKFMDGERAKL